MTLGRGYKHREMVNNIDVIDKIHIVENFTYQRLGSNPPTVIGKESDCYKIQNSGYIW